MRRTPTYSRIIRLVPPLEGCRLPLNGGLIPASRLAQLNRGDPPPSLQLLQSLRRYYEAVRPSPAHRYFRPHGGSRLRLFPSSSPARFSRSVPEPDRASRCLHAGCRWAVSGHPPSLSWEVGQPPVSTSPKRVSTLLQQFACARLSRSCLPGSSSRRFRDAHDHGF